MVSRGIGTMPEESRILAMLNLIPQMLIPISWKLKTPPTQSLSYFTYPLEDFIKLNFD